MPIRYLMGFNTTDLPPNFNDRFRDVFKMGIFAGGGLNRIGPLQIGVSPFVAVTCDGGVVRDDVDTQYLTIPAGKPGGMYICLLAKYRDFDEPQLEWKVVEPSCLLSCEDADCFIIYGMVTTDSSDIVSIVNYDPHRADQCNKEDIHVFQTIGDLPIPHIAPDGVSHNWCVLGTAVGRLAFVVENRTFYWWSGTEWRSLSFVGNRVVAGVEQNETTGEVDIDASQGDIFRVGIHYAGPITFNAPTHPVDGKVIEIQFTTNVPYDIIWDVVFWGTEVPLPRSTSGNMRLDRISFEYNSGVWYCSFSDTNLISIGDGAITRYSVGGIAIGNNSLCENSYAVALGFGATAKASGAIAIGGGVGSDAATVSELCTNSVAIGSGSSITGANNSVALLGTVGLWAANSTAIGGGRIGSMASSSIAIGNAEISDNCFSSIVIGAGLTVSSAQAANGILLGEGGLIGPGCTNAIVMGTGVRVDNGTLSAILLGGSSSAPPNPSFIDNGSHNSILLGNGNAIAEGSNSSIVIGRDSSVRQGSGSSIAMGVGVYVGTAGAGGGCTNSVAIGTGVWIDHGSHNSILIGSSIEIESIPLVSHIDSGSEYGIVLGSGSIVDDAVNVKILGHKCRVGAACHNTTVLGDSISVSDTSSTAFAAGNTINVIKASNSVVIGSQINAGSGSNNANDAIAIGKSLNIGTTGTGGCQQSITIGQSISMFTSASILIGMNGGYINEGSIHSIAIGATVRVWDDCDYCVAIGDTARVGVGSCTGAAHYSVAIGPNSGVDFGTGVLAIGYSASASQSNSIAIGRSASSSSHGCVIGARVSGTNVGCALNDFIVHTADASGDPDPNTVVSLRAYVRLDEDNVSPDEVAVIGYASKTSLLIHSNMDGTNELPRRVLSYRADDIAGLISNYPYARILFIDSPTPL